MANHKRVNIKAILTDPVLREELVEGATDFICKVEGIRQDPLSSAAQAVAWAYDNAPEKETGNHRYHWLAAALRAAAKQCQIEWNYHPDYPETEWVVVASDLTAIANELEGVTSQ
jgi:hypothetical protein